MSKKLTKEIFVDKATTAHNGWYTYENFDYVNVHTKGKITCPIHGDFLQTPSKHIHMKRGCPYCNGGIASSKETFIQKTKKIHGDKYDYSKVEYKNNKTKVCIICPVHGEFWQTPDNHLHGKQGCPKCSQSHMEYVCENFLMKNNIAFDQQKVFGWLKYKDFLKLDFYLPDYNVAIECQGEQHYKPYRWEKNDDGLKIRQQRDSIKYELCKKHNLNLYYIGYKDKTINKIKEIISLLQNELDQHNSTGH